MKWVEGGKHKNRGTASHYSHYFQKNCVVLQNNFKIYINSIYDRENTKLSAKYCLKMAKNGGKRHPNHNVTRKKNF